MGIIIGAIVTAAVSVAKAIATIAVTVQGLKTIGSILTALGKALGLIKNKTEVDELGDKAIQSGLDPEEFDCYADYVRAVEEYDDLDPEKSKEISEEEKIQKGLELISGATIEKYEGFPIEDFYVEISKNPEYFTKEKMGEIAKLMEADSENISSILNYVNGSERDDVKLQNIMDSLVNVEKSVVPEITDKEALKNVLNARK